MSLIHSYSTMQRSFARKEGFTLIEILVTLLILSIGLLGVASLQVQGMRNNQSAYLKSQASMLAYDMADRMRANEAQALAGSYTPFDTQGNVPTAPNCSNNAGCTPANTAISDLAEWADLLNGTVSGMSMLPSAQGTVAVSGGNEFTVTISWQETQWDEATSVNALTNQSFSILFRL